MKKPSAVLMIAFVLSSLAFADSNTVAAANILGYTRVINPASNRYVLISVPFNAGTGTVSTLLDIFGTNQLRRNNLLVRCDKVITWDVIRQQYVQYAQKTDGCFYSSTNFGSTAQPVNPVVTRGQSLWILSPASTYAPTDKTIIISGTVPTDGAYTNPIVGNSGNPLSFLANPYPVEMDLNSLINTNDGAKGNIIGVRADKIRLWDDAGQRYINLALKLSPTAPGVNNKWLYATNLGSSVTSAPLIKVKPGQGFLYQTTNAFNWIEPRPYTLE